MDLAAITPAALLAIPVDQPERLFSGPDAVAEEFKALAKRMHPDRGGSDAAFAHLNVLWQAGKERVAKGAWTIPGLAVFQGANGHEYRVRHVRKFDAGMGQGYIGAKSTVAYLFPAEVDDLVQVAAARVSKLGYADSNMRDKMKGRLPGVATCQKVDGGTLLVMERDRETIRLRDLLEQQGGKLDPRHVAWIMSDLYSTACYLGWAGLTHNDLSLDSIFVNARMHTVCVVGGWWHSSLVGQRMARRQAARTVSNAPRKVLADKIAIHATDLTLIRLIGRELLGDPSGSRLPTDKSVPKPLADWLRLASGSAALPEYRDWGRVLEASFGPRRFTELAVTFSDVYGG